MGLSPWQVGATLPVWTPTLVDDTGAAVDLTGATLSLTIHNTQTGEDTTGAGTWQITNATTGLATYTWAAADVAMAGLYDLIIVATYSGGVRKFDPVYWQVVSY